MIDLFSAAWTFVTGGVGSLWAWVLLRAHVIVPVSLLLTLLLLRKKQNLKTNEREIIEFLAYGASACGAVKFGWDALSLSSEPSSNGWTQMTAAIVFGYAAVKGGLKVLFEPAADVAADPVEQSLPSGDQDPVNSKNGSVRADAG